MEPAKITNWDHYQELCETTAIYPEQYKIAYPALGLIGEIGELDNCEDPSNYDKELGDVCWYVAILARDLGIKLSEIKENGNYSDHPFVGGKNSWSQIQATNLTYFAFRIAEVIKKVCRDSKQDNDLIVPWLAMIMSGISYLAIENCKVGIIKIMEMNITKLLSRKERGKLGGSGDKR